MATLAQLRRRISIADGQLQADLRRVRREFGRLHAHYRGRPVRSLLAVFGAGCVTGRWLSPRVLAAAVLRVAGGELLLFGRRTARRLWL